MSVPISNVSRRVVLAASGTGPYSFNFEILANTDISVYRDDTLLTLTTDYTVTINTNGTGYVTLTATPTGATQIAIVGDRAIQRTSDFTTGGDLFATTLNDELDSQTIFAQQNAEAAERALKIPVTDPVGTATDLPKASVRANKYLAFDSSGGLIATAGTTAVPVSAAMEPVVASATLALGRTNFGIGAFNTMTIGHGTYTGLPGGNTSNTIFGENSFTANTTGLNNVAVGSTALKSNTTGSSNVALGIGAMYTATNSNFSIGIGRLALYLANGSSDLIAIGREAMGNNSPGLYNIAIGYRSLYNCQSGGYSNVCVGSSSGTGITTGNSNSAFGDDSLTQVTTASGNVAVGAGAIRFGTSYADCVAVGNGAMKGITAGSATGNVALGWRALYEPTTGSNNIAIGKRAGESLTTGSGNSIIGSLDSSGTYAPVFNVTTESNRFVAGTTSITNAYVQVAWTVVSDQRDKTNFADVPHGLDFVCKLKPYSYQYRESRESDVGVGPVRYGFKAQDVLELEGSNPVIVDTEDQDKLKITDSSIIPILVQAIQELKKEIEELKSSK